jgi:hypothetical protein
MNERRLSELGRRTAVIINRDRCADVAAEIVIRDRAALSQIEVSDTRYQFAKQRALQSCQLLIKNVSGPVT